MSCTNCGKELDPQDNYCSRCGTAAVRVPAPPNAPKAKNGAKAANKLKVLVIDDDPMFLEGFLFKFEKEGFNVVLARSGKEGLAFALSEKPSAILLDVLMPGMNGLDVLRRLKEDPRTSRIPVVMATIVDEKAIMEQGLALGAEYYITKEDMTSDEVVNKVRAAAMSSRAGLGR